MPTLLRAWRSAVTVALCVSLVILTPGVRPFALAQAQPDPRERALAALEAYLAYVQELRDQIDRTQFDVEALAFELAFEEPETIVAWVREQIAFEQYPGLLRGSRGALMSRAGNAFDQAVLLEELLEAAGYEARVVRGELDPGAAEALVRSMAQPRVPAPPFADLEEVERILMGIGELLESPALAAASDLLEEPDLAGSERFRAASADADWLVETLSQEGLVLGDAGAFERLVEEATDYAWVQFRLGAGEAWTDAHPGFAPDAGWPELEPLEVFGEGVPASLHHRFRFGAFIERKEAGVFEVLPVMAPWEASAAELTGTTLTYTHIPDGFNAFADLADIGRVLAESEAFYPFFNGRPAPGALVFDVEGFAFPPAIATDAVAAIVREQGQAAEAATGQLGDLGAAPDESEAPAADDLFTLTAHWLEYTLIAPDGIETVHRRFTFDRRGESARSVGGEDLAPLGRREQAAALTADTQFLLATGRYPDGFVFDLQLERMQQMEPLARALFAEAYEEVTATPHAPWLGHLDLYQTFDLGAEAFADLNYRSEPSLVVRQQSLGDAETARIVIDVVNNRRRAFSIADGSLRIEPVSALRAGVWETWSEGLPLAGQPSSYLDAPAVFRRSRDENIPFRLLTDSSQVSEVASLENARDAVRADLEDGFAVLAPVRLPEGVERAAWWRIDPSSGQTLGMISPGLGGVSTEWVVAISLTTGGIATVAAFFGCLGTPDDAATATADRLAVCGLCGVLVGSIATFSVLLAFEGGAAAASGAASGAGEFVASAIGVIVASLLQSTCSFYETFG